MSAQTVGQWLGLVVIAVTVGAIGFGFVQILLSVRDYYRRRAFYREAGAQMGRHLALMLDARQAVNIGVGGRVTKERLDENGVRIVERFELSHVSFARRGGKTEAARNALGHLTGDGQPWTIGTFAPRPYHLDQPKFWSLHPGEFIIGERLRWESRIMDGDNGPPYDEPRGIFRGLHE